MAEGSVTGLDTIAYFLDPTGSRAGSSGANTPTAFFNTTQCAANQPDTVDPIVELLSPAAGTGITPATEIVFRTYDEAGLVTVTVQVNYADGQSECAFDGVAFKPLYIQGSSVVPITVGSATGFQFALKRASGGWPASPVVQVSPVDAGGNRSAP